MPDPAPGDGVRGSRIDRLCIDTIRTLAMDAVQKANSGHPGTPMALAPVAYTLWQETLRYDCDDPRWPNRDRFVLSNGHASMMLYALLHLAHVRDPEEGGRPAVSLDDIRRFRQLGSRCPGHPEYGVTPGVEATTGPLGQGCGDSVGMAIGGAFLASRFNRPDFPVFDFNVYAFCGDGDLMEGVSSEAASLAGHLQLSNLCWIYDNNHITIDGKTDITFTENVAARFRAYRWNVIHVADANDTRAIADALADFKKTSDRPTLIIVDSHIAFGAPHKQDTPAAHGEPLGDEEVRLTKRVYGWPEDATFLVPDGVYEHFSRGIGDRGSALHRAWNEKFAEYCRRFPELGDQLKANWLHELPPRWDADLPSFPADPKGLATRESSGKAINAVAQNYPWLIGGAADLNASTKTSLNSDSAGNFEPSEHTGRNLHFGIREHGMGAVLNGLALVGLRPFGSSFLVFSDYMRPPMRLAAMMGLPTIYIYTHDSIGLGEDGPTHQPVEQLIGLRSVPNMFVLRPADANEVVEAWRVIVGLKNSPACLVLTRQPLPTFDRGRYAPASGVARGGYVLADTPGKVPDVILIGTGSEVALCLQAAELLAGENIAARVVSLPSWELFDRQDEDYRENVLPKAVKARVAVEAASPRGWERYTGAEGVMLGMYRFGASAPIKEILKAFGFTPDHVVEAAKSQIEKWKHS
ncbi:MAG TPA: transketolase [Xanthobacteraceae bacterium]|nr:transketolase [Xanthobacteraceae bacterium]